MPELPEVETTRRGIQPYVEGRTIERVTIRQPLLRWPVPARLKTLLPGQRVGRVRRRAKYLLVGLDSGTLILHLGMSGSLRVVDALTEPGPHDHLDLVFTDAGCLRLRDPRRFGAVLWTGRQPEAHRLLKNLGPEPLGEDFTGQYLYRVAKGRRLAVKSLLMDSTVVAGIGNIYANEILFRAGIHPQRACNRISLTRCRNLVAAARAVLQESIHQGGTTLRDFRDQDGRPGYFALRLNVYGRSGEPCPACREPIRQRPVGQRSSFYCVNCQR